MCWGGGIDAEDQLLQGVDTVVVVVLSEKSSKDNHDLNLICHPDLIAVARSEWPAALVVMPTQSCREIHASTPEAQGRVTCLVYGNDGKSHEEGLF